MEKIFENEKKKVFFDYNENIAYVLQGKLRYVYLNPTIEDMEIIVNH